MESPSESDQESEDGTNKRPNIVGTECFSSQPREEYTESPSPGPDTSDLTGMGAVGEVVSGRDVRELTSKGASKSKGGEES